MRASFHYCCCLRRRQQRPRLLRPSRGGGVDAVAAAVVVVVVVDDGGDGCDGDADRRVDWQRPRSTLSRSCRHRQLRIRSFLNVTRYLSLSLCVFSPIFLSRSRIGVRRVCVG